MSISGSNSGIPGGIPEFSLTNDQNAATNVVRNAIGMMANTDKIDLSQIGVYTLWKYDTTSSRPTLAPLEQMRVDVSPSRRKEEWKEILEEILNDMPRNVRAAYAQSLRTPPEERNPTLIALAKVLEGTAKILSWMAEAVDHLDPNNPLAGPGSEIDFRRQVNMQLNDKSQRGIIQDSQTAFTSMENELLKMGPNQPFFDDLLGVLNQIGSAYQTLHELRELPKE